MRKLVRSHDKMTTKLFHRIPVTSPSPPLLLWYIFAMSNTFAVFQANFTTQLLSWREHRLAVSLQIHAGHGYHEGWMSSPT
jgi:hypothetical protein